MAYRIITIPFDPDKEKFPRGYRFTLGDRIMSNLLDSLEILLEATGAHAQLPQIYGINDEIRL